MTLKPIVRLLAMTAALSGCSQKAYVLPVADGGPEPSPPAFQGRITSVDDSRVVVAVDGSPTRPRSVTFQLGPHTALFTVYGGFVAAKDLVVGLRVRVWFDEPGLPTDPQGSIAAVLVLAATDPNYDWP